MFTRQGVRKGENNLGLLDIRAWYVAARDTDLPVSLRRLWLWLIALCMATAAAAQSGQPPEDNGTDCGWDFFCHLQQFSVWVLCWLVDIVRPIVDTILGLLPDSAIEGAGTIASVVTTINAWFPLDYAFAALTAYYVFIIIFIIVKYIWKAVPFTG